MNVFLMRSTPHEADGARDPVGVPAGARDKVARSVLGCVARHVPVEFRLPDGSRVHGDDPVRAAVEIVRPHALWRRLAAHPKIGIGEGYTAGDWRVPEGHDLAASLLPFAERMTDFLPAPVLRLRRVLDRPLPRAQRNSMSGSRRNVSAHYDLSNDLFATFLDESLSYSSALFDHGRPRGDQDLHEAQLRKVRRVLDLAGVREGSHVLEIGTGWGTLALEAARRGAVVTTVTLSGEQADVARRRASEEGLTDRIDIRLQDYREVEGSYDAVVSVEMIEAVGEEYWPVYFRALEHLLAPGGTVVLQSILMSHERYLATRNSFGWIQKHIFPGGLIPSLEAVRATAAAHGALAVRSVDFFGQDYAETLRRWRAAFTAAPDRVESLGFDASFRRTWEFYLAYCEAGFASGYLDVAHVVLQRDEAR